jgi:hypothetical protein
MWGQARGGVGWSGSGYLYNTLFLADKDDETRRGAGASGVRGEAAMEVCALCQHAGAVELCSLRA